MGRKKKQSEEYRLLPDGQISMRCGEKAFAITIKA